MTTETYLRRMNWLLNIIESKTEMIALERSKATKMTVPTDSEPVKTSLKDNLSEIMANVADLDVEIQGYVVEYRKIKGQVETLSGVLSAPYIFRRYAQNQSMNEVARGLHVSRSTVYRIREDALTEFENKYGKTYRRKRKFQKNSYSEKNEFSKNLKF